MLSRRGVWGGRRRGFRRGNNDGIKADIRKNRELKQYLVFFRRNVYSRAIWPVDVQTYKYQTMSGFTPVPFRLFNQNNQTSTYNANGGSIGSRIFIKRVTATFNCSAHGIYGHTTNNSLDNMPVNQPPPTTGLATSNGAMINECVVRISLIRSRVAFHTLPTFPTFEQSATYDTRYFIQPTGLIPLGDDKPATANQYYRFYNDILPFDPAKVDVLDDRYIPVTLGLTAGCAPSVFTLKFTHEINEYLDLTRQIDGFNLQTSEIGKFYIFARITPLVRLASNEMQTVVPELSMLGYIKFSYADD